MTSNHLILCCRLLLTSIFPGISVFSIESDLCIMWPKCWRSFQWIFSVGFLWDWLVWFCSPRDSQEYFPAPQFESIDSFQCSAFFMVSHMYMTTGKTIALTMQTLSVWYLVMIVTCGLQACEVRGSPAPSWVLFSLTNLHHFLYSFVQSVNTKHLVNWCKGMVFDPSRPSAWRDMGYADKSMRSSLCRHGEGGERCREDFLVEVLFSWVLAGEGSRSIPLGD